MKKNISKRIKYNKIILWISSLFAFFALMILFLILGVLFYKGFNVIGIDIFTKDTSSPWENGGLRNAIIGQLILSFLAMIIGVPLGVLGGTYLREYSKNHQVTEFIRFINDVMISVPSIVIATFVYAIFVIPMGHFSAYSGIIALCLIMIPVILKTTDDMLSLVPNSLREASIALGAPKYKTIINVVYKGAKTGLFTGFLLAFSRIAGESAPLLFTSLNSPFFTLDLNAPFPSLTVTMFQYATSPYKQWQELAFGGAFILAIFILAINIISKVILNKGKK
ncbi:phosphate ABC transporter permease PstA [Helicobacter cappadocius]|uniref:Phosphate transport system permease protein PstA n=1 Tax=Helicobacter cappadocius TaxID=3063998 RepID=A0AA90PZV7_9HELI|nr:MULTISPECIES: phosphate ABC transporter permease PstA [unclassified Helicobacter]MDO7253610.1 phosphate ABC transporter permease PstA [Helicobacter sp. faydin-H75]MDP2539538.1 phosphate ABC transporter permease PstA [Helicobacter sp. faydin-H76]